MGFKLTEEHRPGSYSRYDLYLMFNDLPPAEIRGIPQQHEEPYDPAIKQPMLEAFYQYSRGGYIYLESLVANTILKRKTNLGTA